MGVYTVIKKFRRWMSRPVALQYNKSSFTLTLANGNKYTASYPRWLDEAKRSERSNVEFRVDNIYWPDIHERLYVSSFITHRAVLVDEAKTARQKRAVIVFIDELEAAILRHRFPKLCHAITWSSWWSE
jgi:hypothetical protein